MSESNQQVEDLFNQAIELSPEERPAFFARLRASDPALAAEVESLVSAYGQVGSLLASPAIEAAAELMVDDRPELQKGRVVGRYEIIGPIGKGGMGEVYLAKDPRLDRKVALKFLPARFTEHRDRLRRFTQEARAASALNHPNIITIHEIGEDGGAHFIATEFIDGQMLRRHLATRMSVPEVLDVAVQVASALAAAHGAGIIHRDIKPENIMLRPDGYVKVLDFGLAKLTEKAPDAQPPGAGSELATLNWVATEPGLILGTVNYMSPEQARGRPVDARTDIFSLGVVIYEMASGRLPFFGESNLDVLLSILDKEPQPLSHEVAGAPAELERIVRRAMSKDREQRYQTVKDLAIDLKNLKEELDFKAKLDRLRPTGANVGAETEAPPIAATGAYSQVATGEPVQPVISDRNRRRFIMPLLIVAALIGLAVAVVLFRPHNASPPPAVVAAGPERGLSYWITVQKFRDGKPFEESFRLRDDINFEKDYRIRLTVSSPQRGHLYLLNEGPAASGQPLTYNLLFPSWTANNGSGELNENQQVQIPQQTWLRFDEQQGREIIWLVWATEPVKELEPARRFANARDKGEIKSPEQNAAVAELLKAHSAARPVVERDSDKTETAVKAAGDILVHAIRLEHH